MSAYFAALRLTFIGYVAPNKMHMAVTNHFCSYNDQYVGNVVLDANGMRVGYTKRRLNGDLGIVEFDNPETPSTSYTSAA